MRRPRRQILKKWVALTTVLLICTPTALAEVVGAAAPATAPANVIRTSASREGTAAASPSSSAALDLPRVIASLAIVIGFILILRWAARRFLRLPGALRSSDAIRVLSRTAISPKQHVLALLVGKRVLIVADNGQQLSTLCELTDEQELAEFTGRNGDEASSEDVGVALPEPASSPRQEIQGLLYKVGGLSLQFR